ncbi:MAG TPA: cytochrome c peroxidase [Thermodesulfovibrionales bacterium]|nr:cytochrome c peroxidase [Thermodesulfovibrionales bacterium]
MRKGRLSFLPSFAVMWGIILFVLTLDVHAGHLEPFKFVPIPQHNPQTPEKIDLGKKLFFDRRLSGDGTMSCASCHIPELAFTDGQDISLSYPTTKNWRNSPTLINAAFYKFLFHDGRVRTLEDQALFPMMSAFEMNKNLDYLEEQIRVVPEYAEAFKKVFGGEVTRKRIAMAIASFERTLVSLNSPLDRYLKGEKGALSEGAKKGFEIFKGKGKCADCHHGVNLSDDKFYALEVPENPVLLNDPRVTATMRFVAKVYHYDDYKNLTEDPGRYLITKNKKDWKAFRTPTLREISKTAPYMHNGVFKTLDEIIDFFDSGGGKGNRALKPLGLSAEDKTDLKSFLVEALNGEEIPIQYPEIP